MRLRSRTRHPNLAQLFLSHRLQQRLLPHHRKTPCWRRSHKTSVYCCFVGGPNIPSSLAGLLPVIPTQFAVSNLSASSMDMIFQTLVSGSNPICLTPGKTPIKLLLPGNNQASPYLSQAGVGSYHSLHASHRLVNFRSQTARKAGSGGSYYGFTCGFPSGGHSRTCKCTRYEDNVLSPHYIPHPVSCPLFQPSSS
jgi:hypothetical protein